MKLFGNRFTHKKGKKKKVTKPLGGGGPLFIFQGVGNPIRG